MPSGNSAKALISQYVSRPTERDVEQFVGHVRQSGCPETFPTITTSKAESLQGAEILARFQINRKKRPERDLAPCPVCSPNAPKYLRGYLVWFPQEACIRAIGADCGHTVDQHWDRKKRAFAKKERERQREEFLFNSLHTAPDLIKELEQEATTAAHHSSIWKAFKNKCPAIAQLLRREMAHGKLSVAEESQQAVMRSSSGGSRYVETVVGSVTGQTAVKSAFNHHVRGRETVEAMKLIERGSDPEDVFLAICEMSTAEMETVEKTLIRSRKYLMEIRRLNSDFRKFFATENLDVINRWGAHPSCEMQLNLKLVGGGKRLHVSSSEFSFEWIDLAHL